jgi:type III secretory pathway component EscV
MHIRQKHDTRLIYECPQCPKTFQTSFGLRNHQARCPQRQVAKTEEPLQMNNGQVQVEEEPIEEDVVVDTEMVVIEKEDEMDIIEIEFEEEYLDEEGMESS